VAVRSRHYRRGGLVPASGIFVVGLVIFGSMIIVSNLNHNMMPMDQIMDIHKQR
jgi:cytochrome o ubiquinol oxidase operon protein cyoD